MNCSNMNAAPDSKGQQRRPCMKDNTHVCNGKSDIIEVERGSRNEKDDEHLPCQKSEDGSRRQVCWKGM